MPLLFSSMLLFPYTQPLVCPKFPHVPLVLGGSPVGFKERMRWANCPCNYSFQDFQPMWSQSTNVTCRQTDRRSTYDRKTALCNKMHCAVRKGTNALWPHLNLASRKPLPLAVAPPWCPGIIQNSMKWINPLCVTLIYVITDDVSWQPCSHEADNTACMQLHEFYT